MNVLLPLEKSMRQGFMEFKFFVALELLFLMTLYRGQARLLLTFPLCLSSRLPHQRREHCFLLQLRRNTTGSSGITGALDTLLKKKKIWDSTVENRTECNVEISFQIQRTGA